MEKQIDNIKVSDIIANFLKKKKIKTIFGIIGAANTHIFDSIVKLGYTKIIYMHHEQALVMAASAYYRASGNISIALVTAGGGASNSITGIVSCWADSIPVIIISGQESSKYLANHNNLRMQGTQGFNISKTVSHITKYSTTCIKPSNILEELEKCYYTALEGRPGPVLLDIPFDIQFSIVETNSLSKFYPPSTPKYNVQIKKVIDLVNKSKRPIILGGHGIRLSGAKNEFKLLVEKLKIPTLLSWSGIDLLSNDNEYFYGRSGLHGQRSANFIIQNCDLLIVIGSRLSLPQTGYDINDFCPSAKIIMVNIDDGELNKYKRYNLKIKHDCKLFINELSKHKINSFKSEWVERCYKYNKDFPTIEEQHQTKETNSFVFIDKLSNHLLDNHIIVTDMGTALISGHQNIKIKDKQIMFTSNGLGEMGHGLPAAIGAQFAYPNRQVLCLNCDGSMMMNLQELQTIINYNLPIKIIIFNNDGYLSIKLTQKMFFKGFFIGVDKKTGLNFPNFSKLAKAFGFKYYKNNISKFLNYKGPAIFEVFMNPEQDFSPKTKGTIDKNGVISHPLEEMSPLLSLDVMKENMIEGINKKSYNINRT